ncbi:MAG: hypothetical protein A2758_00780 [Candidatus Zambryskibacteria bacterium RIFCSPHIGHO2_01_FULL_49_18]|uniref:Uncharacterized protein n=1 Tax=Candidatus Zambryskibacteria bacterium RIFCSPHIGHO2_01_FULL_49_18 TaxID=1802740 RepID=A0A1G2T2X0_9BACT|nr:MAG: hypothetical protein A2758_00780 [Candidatus Zambryskibacteria bacterium RIFCSPHIGHO2_01_FULL_49_18]
MVSVCGVKSPVEPSPTDGNGNPCPTGNTVEVKVVYKRQMDRVNPDSIATPGILFKALGAGQSVSIEPEKVDFQTWTKKISVPENAKGPSHEINMGDPALAPNSWMTASDIFASSVLVAKGPSPSGAGEYGWFRVDGCGKATGVR